MRKTLWVFCLIPLSILGQSKHGWKWGDDVATAKEKNVLYVDALKAKSYQKALPPLQWLLSNTPDLNPSIYINGVKIYEALAKKETDPAKKETIIQNGLKLFDKRIEFFGNKADVLDRKAIFAYTFYSKDKSKYNYLFDLYKTAFELNGKEMNAGNLVAYMNIIYKYHFAGGDLNDEQVIESYSAIYEALEEQKSQASPNRKKNFDKYLSNLDKILTATKVKISCPWVEEKLGPKLTESQDIKLAKKVFDLMIKGRCLDRPLALTAAKIVQNEEPTYAVAKFLGSSSLSSNNTTEAITFFQQATILTDDNQEKAEMYLNIARVHSKRGKKIDSRNSARRAISFVPNYSDAYTVIGDLYYNSFGGNSSCTKKVSQVEDRAVFIAAYNQYKKAGNVSKMKASKAQFPSIEDIFNEGKKEGEQITIGCWINTTVQIARRSVN